MKKTFIFSILIILYFSSLFPQKKIYKYNVSVENKIIYARVFYKGKPVDNLKKDDFILYENGKRVKILGVDIVRKKFGSEKKSSTPIKKQSPRFFILTFKIIDYGPYLKKGIDYIFDNIIKKEDKLMFMSEHHYFVEDHIKDKDKIKEKIIKILKKESVLSRMRLDRLLSNLKSLTYAVGEYVSSQNSGNKSSYQQNREFEKLVLIVQRFLTLLRGYKESYLTPEIDRFYYFAKYLNGIKMKKWILNFYQYEKIPIPVQIKNFMDNFIGEGLRPYNEMKALEMVTELQKELDRPANFPTDEVAKLFYRGDTTFYTIILDKPKDTLSKDFYYRNVYTDLEKTLKNISFSTGGDVILTNNVISAVNKFKEKEDILYMINYIPTVKNPKIKVKMKNPEYKVKYDPNQFSDYIKNYLKRKKKENPDILINGFNYSKNILSFSIKDFKIGKKEKAGRVLVVLKITDEKGKTIYNSEKTLKSNKSEIKVKIKIKNLKNGIFYLYLDVYDLLTKKVASRFEVLEIN